MQPNEWKISKLQLKSQRHKREIQGGNWNFLGKKITNVWH